MKHPQPRRRRRRQLKVLRGSKMAASSYSRRPIISHTNVAMFTVRMVTHFRPSGWRNTSRLVCGLICRKWRRDRERRRVYKWRERPRRRRRQTEHNGNCKSQVASSRPVWRPSGGDTFFSPQFNRMDANRLN